MRWGVRLIAAQIVDHAGDHHGRQSNQETLHPPAVREAMAPLAREGVIRLPSSSHEAGQSSGIPCDASRRNSKAIPHLERLEHAGRGDWLPPR